MRMRNWEVLPCLLLLALIFFTTQTHAALESAGVMDNILSRYYAAATAWQTVITQRASWLFWLLVTISMVWTFGLMALRRSDIGEFFAEFIRFTVFTGFFWWLLINGPAFATSIIASLKQIGSEASGLRGMASPSGIVDIGFEIFYKAMDESNIRMPVHSAAGIIMATVILVILALISVNMVILLISGWILAYAGIFFLGFGGSRWTSDIAINYYKTVLGVAVSLFAMVLLVGIGKTFLDDYYAQMSGGLNLKEMGVLMVVSVVLLTLVNKIPPMLASIVGGGAGGIGNLGAGAAVGAAAAATGVAAGMMMASAAHAAGGASAIKAAFDAAHGSMEGGMGLFADGGGGGGQSRQSSSGGLGQMMDTGARFAGEMTSHLSRGMKEAVKTSVASQGGRVAQTPGGKVADAIRANAPEPKFKGNAFANSAETKLDPEAEAAAFRDSK
ncbi:type IV secretion system protein VirB6/type IV secretion system protein TrbL [Nitrosospira sp. Nsp5]|uniref:Type IV secretion system protein VirB6/type IV secretion system protein TrbL n=1 Tax=Nitrosospira multiformis TaxID=1231 RepID=A0ABY0TMU0_9PROT|nr:MULTISPECIES: P-type conjugative transfer protein TrbL [Nitrosospira]PTR05605.1 type IV secretion system protein VirB6/type IV secretion system protein TrbL [Nitrosospira sp. Nsp5]SDR10980.1 type IV secretion system protein VirB6/type IV secretion system protein TrbL [Nitrosospira multiformis]